MNFLPKDLPHLYASLIAPLSLDLHFCKMGMKMPTHPPIPQNCGNDL